MAAEIVGVIPARFSSTRLPGKALVEIEGVPMVVRVWRQTVRAHVAEPRIGRHRRRANRARGRRSGRRGDDDFAGASKRHRSDRRSRRQSAGREFISMCRAICRLSIRPTSTHWPRRCAPTKISRWPRWRRRSWMPMSGKSQRGESGMRRAGRRAVFFARADSVAARGRRAARRGAAAISACTPTAATSCCALPRSSRACSRRWKSSNNCARSSAAFVSGWWLPWRLRLR